MCVSVCLGYVCLRVCVYVCVFGVCVCYVVVDWVWVDEERMRHMIPELTSVLFWENIRLTCEDRKLSKIRINKDI